MKITNEDNMELMKRYEDNHFDLAIVDPPYGNKRNFDGGQKSHGWGNFDKNKADEWNKAPSIEYFEELKRVSKNQIIWGGNYFSNLLENTQCWLIWDKGQRGFSLADGEMAWTSFNKATRIKTIHRVVANQENKIHPTQKPVKLYEWVLYNNAKEGDKILDTHLGSGSIAIACHNLKFDLTACELDKEYYTKAMERIEAHKKQLTLF